MKKNKIFISLKNYNLPNSTANYGVHLAKNLERPAHLFGVEKVPMSSQPVAITGSGLPTATVERIGTVHQVALKQLKELHHEVIKLYDNVSYNVEIGFPEISLIEKTEKTDPHIVVLEGDNELTTLHEWFGTYETRLAENIEAPVLVLPNNYNWKPVKKILYVMEIDDEKVANMRFLTSIATAMKANIAVVLLSNERSEKEMNKYNHIVRTMRTILGYDNVNFHQFFTQDPANTIDNLLTHVNADWLAFEHASRSFLERMLNNYNTKRLILQSEIPVLVF
ncbi:MAG: hypothetical protein AB8H03_14365 [Saprospiraceae bacterium]